MAAKFATEQDVENEIRRLLESEDVKVARKYERIQYKRRQYMYQLRRFEKEGKQLRAEGITMEMLQSEDFDIDGYHFTE